MQNSKQKVYLCLKQGPAILRFNSGWLHDPPQTNRNIFAVIEKVYK